MTNAEQWKPVVGYEGRYEVSDLGRVRSLPNSRRRTDLILKQQANAKSGHMVVNLTTTKATGGWVQVCHYVHSLVLTTFVGRCPLGHEGCHNDGNPANNALSNLRWGTRSSNQADRLLHGTSNRGDRNGQARFSEEEVKTIKARLAAGDRVGQIATDYGVYHGAISLIKNGKRWSHV